MPVPLSPHNGLIQVLVAGRCNKLSFDANTVWALSTYDHKHSYCYWRIGFSMLMMQGPKCTLAVLNT